MKGKILRKIAASLAGVLLLAGSAGADVLAAGSPGIVTPITTVQSSEVKIHVRDAAEGNVGTGAVDSSVPGTPVVGATLKYVQVADLVQVDTSGSVQLLYQVSKDSDIIGSGKPIAINTGTDLLYEDPNYYYLKPETVQSALSTAIGTSPVTFLNQLNGLSPAPGWAETTATDGQGDVTVSTGKGIFLFIGGTMPGNTATLITPFLLSNPMPDTQGSGWLSEIHVYPKVRSSSVNVSKRTTQGTTSATVSTGGTTSAAVIAETGTNLDQEIAVEIPGFSGTSIDFTKFVIEDMFPTGLGIAAGTTPTLTVQSRDSQGTPTDIPLTSGSDYTIDTSNNKLSVTMSGNGLAALTPQSDHTILITLTYKTALNDQASLGTIGQSATAKVTYQRTGGSEATTTGLTVSVHTYGIDIAKTLSDTGDTIAADEITFTLTKKGGSGTGDTQIAVTGNNGEYWQSTAGGAATALAVGTGGGTNLKIYGLAPGTYVLTETKTKADYSLLAEPVEIVITAPSNPAADDITATADRQAATVNGGAVQLGIVNTKISTGFTLPKTGDQGMLALVVAGVGMICSALVLFAVYRRRNEKK